MTRHRIDVIRPFRFEYRLPAPMEVRFGVFQLNAADLRTRLGAVSALVRLGDPAAVDALVEALDDPLPMRVFAAEAVRMIVPEAPPVDPYAPDEVRRAAIKALEAWWHRHRQRVLDEWLRDRLREAGLNGRDVLDALAAALEHEDLVVRFHAHRRLVEMFGEAVPYDYNWLPSLRTEAARAWRRHLAGHLTGPARNDV